MVLEVALRIKPLWRYATIRSTHERRGQMLSDGTRGFQGKAGDMRSAVHTARQTRVIREIRGMVSSHSGFEGKEGIVRLSVRGPPGSQAGLASPKSARTKSQLLE